MLHLAIMQQTILYYATFNLIDDEENIATNFN